MKRVGLIGWRGMVGSVLMGRMREQWDFDPIDPVFFTTSNVGGKGPDIGKEVPPLKEAMERLLRDDALRARLREGGWQRAQDFAAKKIIATYEEVFSRIMQP